MKKNVLLSTVLLAAVLFLTGCPEPKEPLPLGLLDTWTEGNAYIEHQQNSYSSTENDDEFESESLVYYKNIDSEHWIYFYLTKYYFTAGQSKGQTLYRYQYIIGQMDTPYNESDFSYIKISPILTADYDGSWKSILGNPQNNQYTYTASGYLFYSGINKIKQADSFTVTLSNDSSTNTSQITIPKEFVKYVNQIF